MTDRELLTRICQVLEQAAWAGEDVATSRPRSECAPYRGPFAAALHMPSVRQDIEDLALTIRLHLDGGL